MEECHKCKMSEKSHKVLIGQRYINNNEIINPIQTYLCKKCCINAESTLTWLDEQTSQTIKHYYLYCKDRKVHAIHLKDRTIPRKKSLNDRFKKQKY